MNSLVYIPINSAWEFFFSASPQIYIESFLQLCLESLMFPIRSLFFPHSLISFIFYLESLSESLLHLFFISNEAECPYLINLKEIFHCIYPSTAKPQSIPVYPSLSIFLAFLFPFYIYFFHFYNNAFKRLYFTLSQYKIFYFNNFFEC